MTTNAPLPLDPALVSALRVELDRMLAASLTQPDDDASRLCRHAAEAPEDAPTYTVRPTFSDVTWFTCEACARREIACQVLSHVMTWEREAKPASEPASPKSDKAVERAA
jgi:hypothetical protein